MRHTGTVLTVATMSASVEDLIARCSPQVVRLLQLADIEASANRDQRGTTVNPEHLLIAMAQSSEGACGELIEQCGLSVADIRAGKLTPKTALPEQKQ